MSENIFNNMPRENVESGTEATALNKLPAQDWNRVVFEVNNTIKDAGITPQVFDNNEDLSVQQSQAIMHNALCADFFSDYTTDPNNLILDNNGTFQRPTKYINGMKISFVANYSNTYETCSVNVCGLGSKAIYSDKLRTGLPYNSIKKNQINNIIYLEELDAFLLLRSGNTFTQKIGELIISTIPFDDDKLHLANGDFLPADGQYLDFYKFMKEKYDSGKYNNIFCSEAEYNAFISAKGRCAKYVFSEGFGVRLPTINGIVEGTTNVNELGQLTEETLPQHKHYINNSTRGDSYSAPQDGTLINSSNHMSNNDYFLCGSTAVEPNLFLSSKATNGVYKDNAKVHPETVKQFFYIVVGTYVDDNIPVDKLNLKLNRNMDNLQTILIEKATDVDTIKTSGNYEFLLGAHTNTPFSTETSAFGMLVFTNSEYVYQYVWGYDNSSYHRYYNPTETTWGDWKNIDMSGTGGANLPLLTPQFFDHTLNDASWLRSDTFSWQNGNMYIAVYNKLVEEYNSTSISATAEGVVFRQTVSGFRIADTSQENAIESRFNETGVAWFYILDIENHRFKLPRTKWNFVGYRNDVVSGYVWESLPNITGSYQPGSNTGSFGAGAGASGAFYKIDNSNANAIASDPNGTFKNTLGFNAHNSSSTYQDNAPVQQRATQMYLYFYVGNTIRNIEEVNVGQLTESLNGKADTDLNNIANNIDYIIERGSNANGWYEKYRSGKIKQGGQVYGNGTYSNTLTFPTPFANTNYIMYSGSVEYSGNIIELAQGAWLIRYFTDDKTTTNIKWQALFRTSGGSAVWFPTQNYMNWIAESY